MSEAVHPVFCAPSDAEPALAGQRPVDLAHLASQTGGDKALEEEVLHLFVRQAKLLSRDLKSNRDSEQRRRIAHTLKGSARSVGAFKVAELAKAVEEEPAKGGQISSLNAHVTDACDYIASLLR